MPITESESGRVPYPITNKLINATGLPKESTGSSENLLHLIFIKLSPTQTDCQRHWFGYLQICQNPRRPPRQKLYSLCPNRKKTLQLGPLDIMVSFDVVSLFTEVPINETINIKDNSTL